MEIERQREKEREMESVCREVQRGKECVLK